MQIAVTIIDTIYGKLKKNKITNNKANYKKI